MLEIWTLHTSAGNKRGAYHSEREAREGALSTDRIEGPFILASDATRASTREEITRQVRRIIEHMPFWAPETHAGHLAQCFEAVATQVATVVHAETLESCKAAIRGLK